MSSCVYAIEFKDGTWKIGESNNAVTRLNTYKGPCKPLFCVVQVVEKYLRYESAVITDMKKSQIVNYQVKQGNAIFCFYNYYKQVKSLGWQTKR